MTQFYSDADREDAAYSLPNCEVFYARKGELEWEGMEEGEQSEAGWYYWYCMPGCMPDSDPIGPFQTEAAAIADAREQS